MKSEEQRVAIALADVKRVGLREAETLLRITYYPIVDTPKQFC
jgi:hypothetical protein